MRTILQELLPQVLDGTVGTAMLFTLFSFGVLAVTGMSVYAIILALKLLRRR